MHRTQFQGSRMSPAPPGSAGGHSLRCTTHSMSRLEQQGLHCNSPKNLHFCGRISEAKARSTDRFLIEILTPHPPRQRFRQAGNASARHYCGRLLGSSVLPSDTEFTEFGDTEISLRSGLLGSMPNSFAPHIPLPSLLRRSSPPQHLRCTCCNSTLTAHPNQLRTLASHLLRYLSRPRRAAAGSLAERTSTSASPRNVAVCTET